LQLGAKREKLVISSAHPKRSEESATWVGAGDWTETPYKIEKEIDVDRTIWVGREEYV
jgi:hypothetical protein